MIVYLKNAFRFYVHRVLCHHSYILVKMDCGVLGDFFGYEFVCSKCGKQLYVPVIDVAVINVGEVVSRV